MAGELMPAFEIRVRGKTYRIWANGRTEGFEDGDAPVLVVNNIPLVVFQAVKDATADGR